MSIRRTFRYLFAALVLTAACFATWQYGFSSWPSAVGIPLLFFLAGLTAFGPELYEGLSVDLPGDSGLEFGEGEEEQSDE